MFMLNGPQFKFAAGVASGLSFVDAYAEAYPDANPGSARRAASRLASNVDIQREVERIRQSAEGVGGQALLTLLEKRMFLARVVRAALSTVPEGSDLWQEIKVTEQGVSRKLPDKLRAIALDNDLAGEGAEAELAITIVRAWK